MTGNHLYAPLCKANQNHGQCVLSTMYVLLFRDSCLEQNQSKIFLQLLYEPYGNDYQYMYCGRKYIDRCSQQRMTSWPL